MPPIANSNIGSITLQWEQEQNTPDYTIVMNNTVVQYTILREFIYKHDIISGNIINATTDTCSTIIPIDRTFAGRTITFSFITGESVINISHIYWIDGPTFYDVLFIPMSGSEVSAVCSGTIRHTTDLVMNLQTQSCIDKWHMYVRGITTIDFLVGSILNAIATRLDINPIRNLGNLPEGNTRIPTLLYQLSQDSETGIIGLFKNISLLTSTRDAHRAGWATEWAVNPTSIDITYDKIVAWTVQHAKYLTKALDIIENDLSPDITDAIIRACRSITTANPE